MFAMTAQPKLTADLLARLGAIVGPRGLITDPGTMAACLTDWRGLYRGRAVAIARPASTEEVAAIVRLCAETRMPIVPQGGNTGMCGAATPDTTGNAILVTLARMNKIIALDALNNTVTVEAGCILANIQQAALDADRFFPLSLGAEGSCQIGGNLSTNAGGSNVLRYGNTRDLVLGVEVVVADGRIWNGLRGLRKDNTGYDLKHLFIGAEGTLGIITKAVLKLFPRPRSSVTALAAMQSAEAAVELLALLRNRCGDRISAFEIMSRYCFDMVFRQIPNTREPLPQTHPWYVLADLSDTREGSAIRDEFERTLAASIEHRLVSDVVVAESQQQALALWRLREAIPEAARSEGLVYRHDIAVAVSRVPEFIATASRALETRFPGVRIICFGHLGDGNLHFNAFVPGRARDDAQARAATDVNRVVHDIVHQFGGSISAEHGIGQAKRGDLKRYKSEVELELMRALKKTLDPHNLMNPGKVL